MCGLCVLFRLLWERSGVERSMRTCLHFKEIQTEIYCCPVHHQENNFKIVISVMLYRRLSTTITTTTYFYNAHTNTHPIILMYTYVCQHIVQQK